MHLENKYKFSYYTEILCSIFLFLMKRCFLPLLFILFSGSTFSQTLPFAEGYKLIESSTEANKKLLLNYHHRCESVYNKYPDSALIWIEKAKSISNFNISSKAIAYLNSLFGDIYKQKGELSKASIYYFKPIEGVKLTITDKQSGKELFQLTTSPAGDILQALADAKLNDVLSYSVKIEKNGYVPKTSDFSVKLEKPGQVNMRQWLDMNMEKIAVGMA